MANNFLATAVAPTMPAPVGYGGNGGYSEASLIGLIDILRRHRILIILTTLVLLVPAVLYALKLETKYTAWAAIVIDTPDNPIIISGEADVSAPNDANLETQLNLIRSRSLVEQTMQSLGLFDDPEFLPAANNGQGARSPAEKRQLAVDVFTDNLSVTRVGESYVLEVAFTSTDPRKAAAITNKIADLYIAHLLKEKVKATQKTRRWLKTRLAVQSENLSQAETLLADFRAAHPLILRNGDAASAQQLSGLEQDLFQTQAAESQARKKLALVAQAKASGRRLDTLDEIGGSPVLSQLRIQEAELKRRAASNASKRGALHPQTVQLNSEIEELRATAQAEIDRIVRGLRDEAQVAAAQAGAIAAQLSVAKGRTASNEGVASQLEELESNATALRAQYETTLTRYQEATGQQGILEPDARIVSAAAIPMQPSTPSPFIFPIVALGSSLMLGCVLALLRENTNQKLRSLYEVEQDLQMHCVGFVPREPFQPGSLALHDRVGNRPRSALSQSVRALYTQLSLASPSPQVLLVTSSLPGEGKTTLATALGICAAKDNVHTVLVDFDLWRPSIAKSFDLNQPTGVAEVINDQDPGAAIDRAVIVDHTSGLHILAAGSPPHDTMPWMGRQRLGDLLDELRKRYEFIVIDSPPILGVSDGRLLASHADASILAVRWGSTDRATAAAGLRTLKDSSANIAGVVLTQVNMKEFSRFGPQYHTPFQSYYVDG